MGQQDHSPKNIKLNRQLRQAATAAEEQLWVLLRNRKLAGCKFGRQPHVCGWVVDFACLSHQLIAEVDGAAHELPDKAASDARSDEWLACNGWTVLRFRNGELRDHPQGVIEAITRALLALTPAASVAPALQKTELYQRTAERD
jgi:very-short-patch-repair endonuclease